MTSAFAQVSDDRLKLWYASTQNGPIDVFHSSRTNTSMPFGPGMMLFANVGNRATAALTTDGLTIVYGTPMGLKLSTRANVQVPFTDGQPIFQNQLGDTFPHLVPDGSVLYHSRGAMGGPRILRSLRTGAFQPSSSISGLDAVGMWGDLAPAVTADERTIYFGSNRPGSTGFIDVWVARRSTKNDPFGTATLVPEVSSPDLDVPSWISPDDCELYWTKLLLVDGGPGGPPTLLHAVRPK
jgi:hypothetical protein